LTGGRRAGVLAHVTSLPGRFGIGDLGSGAIAFLDWAREAGFSVWQVLPLHPAGSGASPYDARSAFAGNALLLSPEALARDELLGRPAPRGRHDPDRVDFRAAERATERRVSRAWARFRAAPDPALAAAYEAFVADPSERAWLEDWAAYAVLRRHHAGRAWPAWDEDLRSRRPPALRRALGALAAELDLERWTQFLFRRQWLALHEAARERGIEIFGDLPFYVALDSADVWAHQDLFDLDERGRPARVGGVPPDLFSVTGQRWGQPTYRWDRMAQDGFAWWVARVGAELRLFDLLRLDHFRGFSAYWEIDGAHETAERGRWVTGPGRALFEALAAAHGALPLVAEDLGVITADVAHLRDTLGLPGLHVAQFAFGDDAAQHERASHRPHDVVYSGTHDNDTLDGWLAALDATTRQRLLASVPDVAQRGAAAVVEWVYRSPCALAIVPLQDLLGLGSAARMNVPGSADGHWAWRARAELLTPERAASLRAWAVASGRAAAGGTRARC